MDWVGLGHTFRLVAGGLRLCAAAVVARVGRGRRAWRSGVLVFRVVSERANEWDGSCC
jgi:hypothetical protein